MIDVNDKVFYNPGDIVRVRHEKLENVPVMYVIEKVTRTITNKDATPETVFLGMKCRWFDNNGVLRDAIFSSKDLEHVE